jgi:hypothetical protein
MWFEDHIGGLLEGTGVRTTVLTVLNRTLFASVLFKKIYFLFHRFTVYLQPITKIYLTTSSISQLNAMQYNAIQYNTI